MQSPYKVKYYVSLLGGGGDLGSTADAMEGVRGISAIMLTLGIGGKGELVPRV